MEFPIRYLLLVLIVLVGVIMDAEAAYRKLIVLYGFGYARINEKTEQQHRAPHFMQVQRVRFGELTRLLKQRTYQFKLCTTGAAGILFQWQVCLPIVQSRGAPVVEFGHARLISSIAMQPSPNQRRFKCALSITITGKRLIR